MSLEFRHIAHVYGRGNEAVRALTDISLTAPAGEITCLLGSSGCGKSTLLNLAAGLLDVQEGEITLGGEALAAPHYNPPPEKRPVGLVFQDGALFPHMNIARNIAFGMGGASEEAIEEAIEAWLERVGLAGLGERYPHELSGGQQQRAALARAMAPGPQVLLMDEPFASVDIVLRRALRRECRMLLREQGATTILVTHDPDEALDIADRIAVMEAGRIVQFGTPQELHDSPATASVGEIFGGAQIVSAVRDGETLKTAFGTWPLSCVAGDCPQGPSVDLLVFAEHVDLVPGPAGLKVRDVHPLGERTRVLLVAEDEQELTAETLQPVKRDSMYLAAPQAGSVRAFPAN